MYKLGDPSVVWPGNGGQRPKHTMGDCICFLFLFDKLPQNWMVQNSIHLLCHTVSASRESWSGLAGVCSWSLSGTWQSGCCHLKAWSGLEIYFQDGLFPYSVHRRPPFLASWNPSPYCCFTSVLTAWQLDSPRASDLREQSRSPPWHGCHTLLVHTGQPRSFRRGEDHMRMWMLGVGSLWRWATTKAWSAQSKGRGRWWGGEQERQEMWFHRDAVKSEWQSAHGEEVSQQSGIERVGEAGGLVTFPVSSVFQHDYFMRSLILVTHIHLGTGLTCTESVLSPVSWHHHEGLDIPPAGVGLVCSLGLVWPQSPCSLHSIMLPSWFQDWGKP